MRIFASAAALALCGSLIAACGSDDHGSNAGSQGATGGASQGGLAGSSFGGLGVGGAASVAGGTNAGGTSGGAAATGTGGDGNKVCVGRGEVLPGGGCYIGCEYNGADPPR